MGRLTGWYILSIFILVAFSGGYLYWTLSRALRFEGLELVRARLSTVSRLLSSGPDSVGRTKQRIENEWVRSITTTFVRVTDRDGNVLIQTPQTPTEVISFVFPAAPESQVGLPGQSYVVTSARLPAPPGFSGPLTVQIALDLSREELILATYRHRLLAVVVLALLISLLIGRRLALTSFRPVQQMARTTQRIRSSTLHERIEILGLRVELKPLGTTIKEMLDRLEDSFERLTRFTSDIAHELRTPVNNFRGEIEVALGKARGVEEYREVLASCLEETTRLAKIIDSLLFLAKAENPAMLVKKELVALAQEVGNIVEFYEPAASEGGITLASEIAAGARVLVERTLFQRAVSNLISNAIDHSPRDTRVRVIAFPEGREVVVRVIDQGEGISEKDLPHIIERFYRADPSRKTRRHGGMGLGLAIVHSIMKLHGGSLKVSSPPGQGTEVELRFPTDP